MNRAERKRQARQDEARLAKGVDPETRDPAGVAAMGRQLYALFEKAREEGSIDAPVKFFHAKVEATIAAGNVAVACAKGCSHCCHSWVSATAPELLYVAKVVRKRGEGLAARIMAAHQATKDFDAVTRARRPLPCPMLESHICTIYESRPAVCRFAASVDASACERVLRLLQNETIPAPLRHIKSRAVYEIAMTIALIHAALPHRYYEFNAGLARALMREDAESAWLAGEDVFQGVRLDPSDAIQNRNTQMMYQHAFGEERGNPSA